MVYATVRAHCTRAILLPTEGRIGPELAFVHYTESATGSLSTNTIFSWLCLNLTALIVRLLSHSISMYSAKNFNAVALAKCKCTKHVLMYGGDNSNIYFGVFRLNIELYSRIFFHNIFF